MAGPSSNSSFIPKRGPVKRKHKQASRRVYVFTLVSYILMFATLLASGGVFLYGNYIEQQREKEIAELNEAISSFSEKDMQRVLEFELRLQQAAGRIENSISMVSVLEALERATIDTVQVERLSLERVEDEELELTASIITDSFDSTMFQRDIYRQNQVVENVTISDVDPTASGVDESEAPIASDESILTFTAGLDIPLSAVPYTVTGAVDEPVTITDETLEAELMGDGEQATSSETGTETESGAATSTNETSV